MILALTIGECVICGHKSILFDDGEAFICVDRDTCSSQEAPQSVQRVFIGEFGPIRSSYYYKNSGTCRCSTEHGCRCYTG